MACIRRPPVPGRLGRPTAGVGRWRSDDLLSDETLEEVLLQFRVNSIGPVMVAEAVEAGARHVCVCDTVGCATPRGTRNLVRWSRNLLDRIGPAVGLDWHGHDDRGPPPAAALVELGPAPEGEAADRGVDGSKETSKLGPTGAAEPAQPAISRAAQTSL